MDPTIAFVMALLALVVSSAGFVVSVLTYLHTRRRDFPESKLRLVHRREDGTIHVHVESVGAGVATRIESWVWDHSQKVWYNQGPWAVPMAPGDRLSAGQFEPGGRFSQVRVSWYDDARPDKRRTVTLRWKS